MVDKNRLLRQLPAINIILQTAEIQALIREYGHPLVSEAAGEVVQQLREKILKAAEEDYRGLDQEITLKNIIAMLMQRVYEKVQPRLRRVINATGIVLHTNLGRAILGQKVTEALTEVASGYSNLELDLSTGERGSRYAHVEGLICRLTGAEAALVVNNNAAAVLLVLNTLAKDKEVVVSRGQLVEIGGSFRIPDVMRQSGAILVEVGTTNKTHLADYLRAITENTALLLKVHTSNYRIIGFTSEVSVSELAQIGHAKGIPVYEDLGSGVLVDFRNYGLTYEPTVQDSIRAGVDLVSFSGDKLFGGPQAGIIAGRRELIEQCKKNPLTRALRVDKLTFAALEATLRIYFDENRALMEIPTLQMLTIPYGDLLKRVKRNARNLSKALGGNAKVEVIQGFSQVGGGALPEENIPSPLVAVKPVYVSVNWLEEHLRGAVTPILARIQKDQLLLDYRTILPDEENEVISVISELLADSSRLVEQEVSF
ncbi:L-seryl-tRNA selenium transferase [Thermincola ferriacetica]|uniref:L-seryl-tRNA(Sec) selenium transferase n=1 Tax=Thermincola ferriacetica TaxID=281456 RepID=A0A0L6W0J8_9FIRM|nr:L-seryl-tRNA(Sec) selenium transferase [Thermincola ferriacetica]KNZ68986.1 L-seryl-tRNA selenium transferase [Thermincola ferriacetica]